MLVGKSLTKVVLLIVTVLAVLPQYTSDYGWQIRIWAFLTAPSNEIGDTFAGIAGVIAFTWIIITVWLQSQELSDQRKVLIDQRKEFTAQNENLKEQIYENMFFQMLSTLGEIIEAVDLHSSDGKRTTGRDCFRIYFNRLKKRHNSSEFTGTFEEKNAAFFERYGHEFGHYFRFLYNFYRFMDESQQTKSHHLKLLRAFLSDYELLLLYYNALTEDGKNFRQFIEKYEMFDNLRASNIILPRHFELYAESAFGRNRGYLDWRASIQ